MCIQLISKGPLSGKFFFIPVVLWDNQSILAYYHVGILAMLIAQQCSRKALTIIAKHSTGQKAKITCVPFSFASSTQKIRTVQLDACWTAKEEEMSMGIIFGSQQMFQSLLMYFLIWPSLVESCASNWCQREEEKNEEGKKP